MQKFSKCNSGHEEFQVIQKFVNTIGEMLSFLLHRLNRNKSFIWEIYIDLAYVSWFYHHGEISKGKYLVKV